MGPPGLFHSEYKEGGQLQQFRCLKSLVRNQNLSQCIMSVPLKVNKALFLSTTDFLPTSLLSFDPYFVCSTVVHLALIDIYCLVLFLKSLKQFNTCGMKVLLFNFKLGKTLCISHG